MNHDRLAGQRVLLASRGDDLRDGIVRQELAVAGADEESAAARAESLIALSVAGLHTAALDAVQAAPERVADFLFETALIGDAQTLNSAAQLAYTTAATDTDRASALIFQAVANVLLKPPDNSAAQQQLVTAARRLAPGHETEWITLLVRFAADQPAVLVLIPYLTSPMPEGDE